MSIGWYVHHHGHGHRNRAAAVRAYVRTDVTVLSSLPRPPEPPRSAGRDVRTDWVELARDDVAAAVLDPTAHQRLHWVPLGDAGLRARMATIAAWIERRRPSAMVVDVSVEVTLLARLFGVPVVVVAGPGERRDDPHRLAYDIAERIIVPWPRDVYDPAFLHPYRDKTHYVGAISRFDGLDAEPTADREVVVLAGSGGTSVTEADVALAGSAAPGWRWTSLGLSAAGWTDDVWPRLSRAAVVVTHGGQNALAEVAAALRPTVVVPQERPFAEQVHVAAALQRHGIAVTAPTWPAAPSWAGLLDAAVETGGQRWRRWSTGHGAQDAAAVIDAVGGRP